MSNGRPIPVRDGDSTPFWNGVDQHELRIQQCQACAAYVFYPRSICPHCFSDQLIWNVSSGRGRIYSYTVVHRSFGPFEQEAPFVVAIVELEEGVRMMTRIVGPASQVKVDAPVRVTYERVDDDLTLPYFQLEETR
ncbi:Zn-ribbon domain-containing OB-fold protein [Alicyclobacillus cycloheptanicus]|uniref:OB-fold protein n=1 Tax=Alicyclobacillus cycloheptanicus TaxID=1457 RepID=A0ABT9XH11_9BACL|nr:Zn-ribbon domain-containing OB-fold protein [Alicyclobacillus cycloheptanicus]MDQ0189482.1 putative OB-fold protein [Alicyclobacillus cycloheptanicus]WDM01549.1 Zn-ribbon domain-containing OB-fold protein [Alicyclobacillus cycloheptanicus]